MGWKKVRDHYQIGNSHESHGETKMLAVRTPWF